MLERKKKVRRDPVKISLTVAGIATLLGIAATGLVAYDDNSTNMQLQRLGLFIMLVSFIAFIGTVISAKKKEVRDYRLADDSTVVEIQPSHPNHFLVVDDSVLDGLDRDGRLNMFHPKRMESVRIVIARSMRITGSFVQLLDQCPYVSIIDLQGSSVSDDVWEAFIEYDYLKHIFIADSVAEDQVKVVGMTIPDVRLWTQPRRLMASNATL